MGGWGRGATGREDDCLIRDRSSGGVDARVQLSNGADPNLVNGFPKDVFGLGDCGEDGDCLADVYLSASATGIIFGHLVVVCGV